jgi:hypothetical protein
MRRLFFSSKFVSSISAAYSNRPSEPQVVAKLIELYPNQTFIAVHQWARVLPEEVKEVLASYGGLGSFLRSQPNFFLVKKENEVLSVCLTPLSSNLQAKKYYKEKMKNEPPPEKGVQGDRAGVGTRRYSR